MKCQDLFFDRTTRDDAIDHHRLVLSESVRSVRRLIFYRWVPPRVHMDNVVCCGQVQTGSSGLQRNQEDRVIAVLEIIDTLLSFQCRSRTVQVLVADASFVQSFSDQCEMLGKLTEYQGAVSFLTKIIERLT